MNIKQLGLSAVEAHVNAAAYKQPLLKCFDHFTILGGAYSLAYDFLTLLRLYSSNLRLYDSGSLGCTIGCGSDL